MLRLGSASIESGAARMGIQKKSRRLLDIPLLSTVRSKYFLRDR